MHLAVAALCIGAFVTLGDAFSTAIAREDRTASQPSTALSAQAGAASFIADSARLADEARIPTRARPLRTLSVDELAEVFTGIECGDRWSRVHRELAPLGDVSWVVEDYLRDVTRAGGRSGIGQAYAGPDYHAAYPSVAGPLAAALFRKLRWTGTPDDYLRAGDAAALLDIAAGAVPRRGRELSGSFAAKLDIIGRLFDGGATKRAIREVYGDGVRVLRPERFLRDDFLVRHLPEPGSQTWLTFAADLRAGIERDHFAVLPLSDHFPRGVGGKLRWQFRNWRDLQYRLPDHNYTRRYDLVDSSAYRPYREELTPLDSFAAWQSELLNAAFPAHTWTPEVMGIHPRDAGDQPIIRTVKAGGDADRGADYVAGAHYDPVVVASTIDFEGPGTRMFPRERRAVNGSFQSSTLPSTAPVHVGTGDLVFFTGVEAKKHPALRLPPMLHGSPEGRPRRTFVAGSFKAE